MHWDRMFEDLEGQLAAEWEAERAALDAESERLRISRLELVRRLRALCAADAALAIDLPGARRLRCRALELGADWLLVRPDDERGASAVPLAAIRGIRADHGMLLASLHSEEPAPTVRERMTLGFLLRDLARRRTPVAIEDVEGAVLHGTIDRAGADHLDLAEHDAGSPRRAADVRGFRIVPFPAIARVRFDAS